ncbi:hypothetical protein CAL12_16840 [Bordetella genomosp. 8]|uniref:Uncharacterized protein n=1 Tax=Bordetella genomosp. 8 TaxID=1416806 RepID=A0A1W6YN16_9BORD|nr:hypothetical protein [Bordetella genomosp. 8]ARP82319.1 hypothetical protein CAL12_16840 [Bordetella genomosp. 8]
MQSRTASGLFRPLGAFVGTGLLTFIWLFALVASPGLQRSGISVIVARFAVHLIVLSGAWMALSHTSLTELERRRTWAAIAVPLTIWHGAAWTIVAKGLLLPGVTSIPLLPLMIIVPTAAVIAVLWRSSRIGLILDAMPPSWLVGLQAYRVIGGVFLVDWFAGNAPGAFAIPAGIGDVITGLLALPTAILLAKGQPGSIRSALLWNFIGISDLVIAVTLGALTSPGPLQHLAFDNPNLLTGAYPTAIIPAFTVPTSLVLHALSLRQLIRRKRPVTTANA